MWSCVVPYPPLHSSLMKSNFVCFPEFCFNRPKENLCLSTQAKLPHYISTALLFNGLVNNLCHIVNSKIKKMELLSFPKETKYMYSIYWLISEIWLENFKIFFGGGGGKLNCLSINKEQNKLTYRIICIYTTSG